MRLSPFILLCTTGLFGIFSSTVAKSPVLPLFTAYLGGNPTDIGMVAAVSSFMGVVASVPAGIFSDKIGRKRMLIASALIFATAPFFYLFITTIWQLMLVRFYHGLATAIFVPVAMAYISELFYKERGEKLGWFSTATLLGRFAAPVAGGTVISLLIFSPAWSYKAVYLLCAAAGIITLILAFRLPHPHPSTEQSNWQNKEAFKNFRKIIGNRAILLTCIVEAAVLFAYGTFETFLPIYAIQLGHSAYEIGILLSVQVITLAIAKPFMGKFSDRHGRKPQIVGGSLIAALSVGSLPLFEGFPFLLLMSIFIGLSLSIVTSATSAYVADLSKKESYGSTMGLLGSIMDIGHTTGPLISGIVAYHFGIAKSFLAALIVVAVAGIFFMLMLGIKKDK
jgi:MFS family permease